MRLHLAGDVLFDFDSSASARTRRWSSPGWRRSSASARGAVEVTGTPTPSAATHTTRRCPKPGAGGGALAERRRGDPAEVMVAGDGRAAGGAQHHAGRQRRPGGPGTAGSRCSSPPRGRRAGGGGRERHPGRRAGCRWAAAPSGSTRRASRSAPREPGEQGRPAPSAGRAGRRRRGWCAGRGDLQLELRAGTAS